jgi:hypothetical protein
MVILHSVVKRTERVSFKVLYYHSVRKSEKSREKLQVPQAVIIIIIIIIA